MNLSLIEAPVVTISLAFRLLAAAAVCVPAGVLAQTQTWQRRGAPPPAGARVVPENCRTASDGSITCGTSLEGSGRRGPAAPSLDPFPN